MNINPPPVGVPPQPGRPLRMWRSFGQPCYCAREAGAHVAGARAVRSLACLDYVPAEACRPPHDATCGCHQHVRTRCLPCLADGLCMCCSPGAGHYHLHRTHHTLTAPPVTRRPLPLTTPLPQLTHFPVAVPTLRRRRTTLISPTRWLSLPWLRPLSRRPLRSSPPPRPPRLLRSSPPPRPI